MSKLDDSYLTPKQVASILQVKEQTLAKWRCTGQYGLSYLKFGKLIRYSIKDVEEFIESCSAE